MSNTNGNAALTNDEWDAWTDAKIEAVLGAAVTDFGRDHPDYVSLLGRVGDALLSEAKRAAGGEGGSRHLHPVD